MEELQTGSEVVEEVVVPTTEESEIQEPVVVEESDIEKELRGVKAQAAAERRKAREAREEAEELRRIVEASKQPPKDEEAPSESDFGSKDEYLLAMARYEARRELKAENDRIASEKAAEAKRNEAKSFKSKVDTMMDNGSAEFDDFDAVYQIPLSEHTLAAALESKNGHKILHSLAKNPEEAQRIYSLSPYGQAIEIGKIEARLTNAAKKVTSAPDPISPVGGGGAIQKTPATMSDDEYRKWSRENRRKY